MALLPRAQESVRAIAIIDFPFFPTAGKASSSLLSCLSTSFRRDDRDSYRVGSPCYLSVLPRFRVPSTQQPNNKSKGNFVRRKIENALLHRRGVSIQLYRQILWHLIRPLKYFLVDTPGLIPSLSSWPNYLQNLTSVDFEPSRVTLKRVLFAWL